MQLKTLKDLTNILDIEYPNLPIKPNISIRREVLNEVNNIEPNTALHPYVYLINTGGLINTIVHKYFSAYIEE